MKPLLLRRSGILPGLVIGAVLFAAHAWLIFVAGLVAGAAMILAARLIRGTLRRVDRALPDRARDWSPSDQDAYLDGIERGRRGALRSAGYEDGKLSMGDDLIGRPTP